MDSIGKKDAHVALLLEIDNPLYSRRRAIQFLLFRAVFAGLGGGKRDLSHRLRVTRSAICGQCRLGGALILRLFNGALVEVSCRPSRRLNYFG